MHGCMEVRGGYILRILVKKREDTNLMGCGSENLGSTEIGNLNICSHGI